jgi:hypothetical protein
LILPKPTWLGLLALSAIGACSSPPPPDGDALPPPVQTVTTLLPEGIWTRATNLDHYHVFASQDEAVAWFEAFDVAKSADEGRPADKVVPHDDTRYASLEGDIASLWLAFQRLFPRDTQDLDGPPRVLLIERTDVNAYAAFDEALTCRPGGPAGCAPHAFIVHTASLGMGHPATTIDPLPGLLAHELSHHVLKHTWPGVADKVKKYYAASAWPRLGAPAGDDAALRATGEKWIDFAKVAGPFPVDELHGLPWLGTQPLFAGTLTELVSQAKASGGSGCADVAAAAKDLDAFVPSVVDVADQALLVDGERGKKLDMLSSALVGKLEPCLASVHDSLYDVIAQQTSGVLTPKAVEGAFSSAERSVVDAAHTPFDALLAVTEKTYQEMRAIDTSGVRFYSIEEEADEVGIHALFRSGRDARSLATFFGYVFLDDASRGACDARIAKNTEPPFGILSDEHHATCWRIDHARRLVRYLSGQ